MAGMARSSQLLIRIDTRSAIPPFEQIRAQISLLVASGRARPASRLPTIRSLADQLGVAPNTVARAYRELELAGIVEARGRAGTFVSVEPPVAFAVIERTERLEHAAATFAHDVVQLGVDSAAALEAVAGALRAAEERLRVDDS